MIVVLGAVATTDAAVLRVPAEYGTIQEGIDAACDGDTVLVADGIYTGDGNRDIDYFGKAILVTSENGPHVTIIDCEASGWENHRGFIFTHGEGPTSVLRGFTITNAQSAPCGGAIRCAVASSPTIEMNIIVGNVSTSGGGICCSASSPILWNNTMLGNQAYDGGAVAAVYHSYPTIVNTIMRDDTAGTGNELYWDTSSSFTVTYSNVEGGWAGEGNIDEDPKFVWGELGDYRLRWQSPCVDAGQPSVLDPDGTCSDIGAHFFDQSKPLVTCLTPGTLTVAQGEVLQVLYTLMNCHGEPQGCGGVAELRLPNGNPWPGNPLEGPWYQVVPPEYTWRIVREYQVPLSASLGTYTLIWRVGLEGELFDKDRFAFTVVEP